MRGYIVIDRPELKVREYELYTAYYCGVCRSVAKRYGQFPRLALTYDAAFLAILLSALSGEEESLEKQHCIVHPVRERPFVVNSEATDYAADMMLILAYGKLDDDVRDEGKLSAKLLKRLAHSSYLRLSDANGEVTSVMEKELRVLSRLEKKKSPSLDETSASFGRIMGTALMCYSGDDGERAVLYNTGYHLGRWIYIADAADDLEEDIEKNRYNPLVYRFAYDGSAETAEEFRARIKEATELNLYDCLGEAAKALDLLDIKKNEGIVKNVIYLGLRLRTEEVLSGKSGEKERKVL